MRALLLAILLTLAGPAVAEPPAPIIATILYEHCGHTLGIMFIRADGDYRMVRASELTPDLMDGISKQVHALPPKYVHIVNDTVDCPEV